MNFFSKLNIVTKMLIGLLVGVVLGLVSSAYKINYLNFISVFGSLYIQALKSIAPILVFVIVVDSLASGKESAKQTKGIKNVILLYLISSFAASVVAVIASFAFKVTMPGLKAVEASSVETNLLKSIINVLINVVSNPIEALAKGDYLPILFWAVILGIMLKKASLITKNVISNISIAITKIIQLIISFAPIGVMGLVYEAVSTNGILIFVDYGKLILLLVVVMIIIALVINPIIVWFCINKNPYPLVIKCLLQSGINAFFTRSSAANIPINMDLCKELELDPEIYSVTIPLGSTINMAGAAAVIAIMALSTAWTLNMEVSFGFAMLISLVSTVAAAGTAGTAGGSLMLIPLACSLLGISPEVAWYTVGVGGTIGVIQDSVETMVNSSSDVLLTATAELMMDKKKKKSLDKWLRRAK